MPTRATKRGDERTRLERDCDVLVCGASFAGLAVARELAGSGARVLVIDRYEIGERQTSACAMPTTWLQALELMGSLRQSFGELVVHTPFHTARWPLPWSFSTFDYRELCVGVGSFWPSHHVKEPTVRLAGDLGLPAVRYQGNWIPHQLRRATEDDVFFAGDSAGHCLPLTAEGIRTALYFGLACGRELRRVLDGRSTREQALQRYGAFSDGHARKFGWLLRVQRLVGQLTPSRAVTAAVRCVENPRLAAWIFEHYLAIAPPTFVGAPLSGGGG